MTYLVLLEFENEEMAMTLVEDMLDNPEGRILTPVRENDVFATVKAIYKEPTQFCDTYGGCSRGRKGSVGWTMGQKWGWWVCAICKKPSKITWENILEKQSGLGKNLLRRLFDLETKV